MAERIAAELAARAPGLLHDFPIARYLERFAMAPALAPYHHVPPQAQAFAQAIESFGGAAAIEAYHRLTLLHLITSGACDGGLRLTREVLALRHGYLARVMADVAKGRRGFFRHGNDQFAKDFAVCRGRLLPCGVELLDPRAGVPRSLLWRDRGRQLLPALRLVQRLGGFRPLWGLHFDRRLVRHFDAEGYAALYLRVADLMALNPAIRGVASWSWWHDPQLAEISPELSFINRHPESGGAQLLRVGEDAQATADALRFAPRRQALHAEGHYRPCVYMLAWPRDDLLAWAAAYRAQARLPGAA